LESLRPLPRIELNRCAALHNVGTVVGTDPYDGTSLIQHSAQCAGQTAVHLYEVRGGGHTWPGGQPYLGKWLVGRVSHELDANEAIWQFFLQQARP
jgi:poly(3-hydroxybutyrate) depolymerase